MATVSQAQAQYKQDQQATRDALRQVSVLWPYRIPAYLSIKEFKRQNKGNSKVVEIYKQNMWASVRRKNSELAAEHQH